MALIDVTEYQVGDRVACSVTFTAGGILADPEVVTVAILLPFAKTPTVYTYGVGSEVERIATGVYKIYLILSLWGMWYSHWEGDGEPQAGTPSRFVVAPAHARGTS